MSYEPFLQGGSSSRTAIIKQRNWWMLGTFALAVIFVGMIIAYAAFSPFLALWGMRNAALAKDGKTFAGYIDFPVFKENLKAEFNAYLVEQMSKDQSLKNNPFSGLGLLLAPTIVNNMVDALVTPAGVERLMNGQFMPQTPGTTLSTKTENPWNSENVSFSYESVNEFRVNILTPEKNVVSLVFERHWIGDWKLAGIKMPR
jgi:hypothetical protein